MNAMDAFIRSMYGADAKKTANVLEAITLTKNELLLGRFAEAEIRELTTTLNNGPVPYSTHDLATSVALGLLRKVPMERRRELMDVQMRARLTVASWAVEGKVVRPLAEAFEHALYTDYHPERII